MGTLLKQFFLNKTVPHQIKKAANNEIVGALLTKNWAAKHHQRNKAFCWGFLSVVARVGFGVLGRCCQVASLRIVGGAGPGLGAAAAQGGWPRIPRVVGASHLGGGRRRRCRTAHVVGQRGGAGRLRERVQGRVCARRPDGAAERSGC